MRRVAVILTTTCLVLSGCSVIKSEPSAEELVALGCKDLMGAEGLNYLQQAADLDPDYRRLAVSVSALQTNMGFIKNENLDSNLRKVLALKMVEDLAVQNAYC